MFKSDVPTCLAKTTPSGSMRNMAQKLRWTKLQNYDPSQNLQPVAGPLLHHSIGLGDVVVPKRQSVDLVKRLGDLVLPVLHQREGQSLPSPFAPDDEE